MAGSSGALYVVGHRLQTLSSINVHISLVGSYVLRMVCPLLNLWSLMAASSTQAFIRVKRQTSIKGDIDPLRGLSFSGDRHFKDFWQI